MNDPVNHPKHYTFGRFEVIGVLEDWFANEPLLWQVGKYIARSGRKGDQLEDLKKAQFYLTRKIGQLETKKEEVKGEEIQYAKFTGLERPEPTISRVRGFDDKRGNPGAPDEQPNDRCSPAPERLEGVRGAGGDTDILINGNAYRLKGGPGSKSTMSVDWCDYRERESSGLGGDHRERDGERGESNEARFYCCICGEFGRECKCNGYY